VAEALDPHLTVSSIAPQLFTARPQPEIRLTNAQFVEREIGRLSLRIDGVTSASEAEFAQPRKPGGQRR
jgi:hypothetical protein